MQRATLCPYVCCPVTLLLPRDPAVVTVVCTPVGTRCPHCSSTLAMTQCSCMLPAATPHFAAACRCTGLYNLLTFYLHAYAAGGCGRAIVSNQPEVMVQLDQHPTLQDLYPLVGHRGEVVSTRGLLISRRLFDLLHMQLKGSNTMSEFARNIQEMHHRHFYEKWRLWRLYTQRASGTMNGPPTYSGGTALTKVGTQKSIARFYGSAGQQGSSNPPSSGNTGQSNPPMSSSTPISTTIVGRCLDMFQPLCFGRICSGWWLTEFFIGLDTTWFNLLLGCC
jgi:hypothetical protein